MGFRTPGKAGMGKMSHPNYRPWMRVLQDSGYNTTTFSVFAQRHHAWWWHSGFSNIIGPESAGSAESSDTINPRVIKWMKHYLPEQENAYVHIHYWDPHTPYNHYKPELREKIAKSPRSNFMAR